MDEQSLTYVDYLEDFSALLQREIASEMKWQLEMFKNLDAHKAQIARLEAEVRLH